MMFRKTLIMGKASGSLTRMAVLVAALGLASFASAQTVVYVAPSGSDVTGDGSALNPYQTLGYAYDQNKAAPGDLSIKLLGGTQADPIKIGTQTLAIGAERAGLNTSIEGDEGSNKVWVEAGWRDVFVDTVLPTRSYVAAYRNHWMIQVEYGNFTMKNVYLHGYDSSVAVPPEGSTNFFGLICAGKGALGNTANNLGNVVIDNCMFHMIGGTPICIYNDANSTVADISNSTFSDAGAPIPGVPVDSGGYNYVYATGGITIFYANPANLTDCTFTRITARAFHHRSGSIANLVRCHFIDCQLQDPANYNDYGYAVLGFGRTDTLQGCTFDQVTYGVFYAYLSNTTAVADQCSFTNSSSALSLHNNTNTNFRFDGNTAINLGSFGQFSGMSTGGYAYIINSYMENIYYGMSVLWNNAQPANGVLPSNPAYGVVFDNNTLVGNGLAGNEAININEEFSGFGDKENFGTYFLRNTVRNFDRAIAFYPDFGNANDKHIEVQIGDGFRGNRFESNNVAVSIVGGASKIDLYGNVNGMVDNNTAVEMKGGEVVCKRTRFAGNGASFAQLVATKITAGGVLGDGNVFEDANRFAASIGGGTQDFSFNWYSDYFDLDDNADGIGEYSGPGDQAVPHLVASTPFFNIADASPIARYDRDGDGFPDAFEYGPVPGTSPTNKDSDGDGIEDGIEIDLKTNPLDPLSPKTNPGGWVDNDGDGLPPIWNLVNIDPDDTKVDTDGDRYLDAYEYVYGANPNDTASKPRLGDVNRSGAVTLADAVVALRVANTSIPVQLTPTLDPNQADVVRSGNLTYLPNALFILRFVNGANPYLPVQ